MVAFRSSPYGAFNHMHACQNGFNILYGGERLFSNSGYYLTYGDAHFKGWYTATRGHNSVLIDDQGQAKRVFVGLSGGASPERAQELEAELNKESEEAQPKKKRRRRRRRAPAKKKGPSKYTVSSEPVDLGEHVGSPGGPPAGRCAEPKAARVAAGWIDGYDVRSRDPESAADSICVRPGAEQPPDADHPQAPLCDTCQANRAFILGASEP